MRRLLGKVSGAVIGSIDAIGSVGGGLSSMATEWIEDESTYRKKARQWDLTERITARAVDHVKFKRDLESKHDAAFLAEVETLVNS